MAAIEQELFERIEKLNAEQKQQVLDYVRQISQPQGELVQDFFERTKNIHFPPEDLAEIQRYIEVDEERIDWDDWNNPITSSV